jgi:AraC-like DNA-binding protein
MTLMNWKNRRRILAVHEHLHKIEVSRLSKLERAARDLKEEEARIVGYLDDNREMIAMFPDLVLQRLKANIKQQQDMLKEVERQAALALEQAKRVKQAERLVANAELAREQALEQEALREILEHRAHMQDISAP